jgi:peptidoglycan pentaglycine glycine transferase (the first glycine)
MDGEGDRRRSAVSKTVTIVDATDWPAERWDQLAVSSGAGHAFQSHAWGELKRPLGWRPRRYVVELDGAPAAVVAFQERALAPRLPGAVGRLTYLYAPRGPILLRTEPEAARAALAGIRQIVASLRTAVVTIDPSWLVGGELAASLGAVGFESAVRDVQVSRTGTIVPLHADENDQHRLLSDTTARYINRARRLGASAERLDPATLDRGDDDLREMYALLAATALREGMILRDREYQIAQWRALAEAGLASVWFSRVEGRRWTGSVLLQCGHGLFQFQAGSADHADVRTIPANHLLQWEIIRWAASNGFATYDLGGVDTARAPGLPRDGRHPLWNLYFFKRGFGAQGVEYVHAHEFAPNPVLSLAWRLVRRLR